MHLIRKCLDDSDDEVRERAYFYIVLIERGMSESVLDQDLAVENNLETAETEEDLYEDLKDFVFNHDKNIDVNLLNDYLIQNKENLLEQEDEIVIDVNSMIN